MGRRRPLAKGASHRLGLELAGRQLGQQIDDAGVCDGELFGGKPARRLGELGDIVYALGGQQLGRDDPFGRDGIPQGLAFLGRALLPVCHDYRL